MTKTEVGTVSLPSPPYCCFTECQKDAEWTIWHNEAGSPESLATEASSDHVGHLLSDAPSHTVVPISVGAMKPLRSEVAREALDEALCLSGCYKNHEHSVLCPHYSPTTSNLNYPESPDGSVKRL